MIQPLQLLRTAERGDCVRERDILFAIDPRPYRRAPHRRLIGARRLSLEGVRIKVRHAPLFVPYTVVYFFCSAFGVRAALLPFSSTPAAVASSPALASIEQKSGV